MPSHHLNQCWNIVNWTHGNKFQWNLYRTPNISIQENALENVGWKMSAILSWPQCVNPITQGTTVPAPVKNPTFAFKRTGWRQLFLITASQRWKRLCQTSHDDAIDLDGALFMLLAIDHASFPLWWLREYALCLIIIIKSELWTIIHCLRLGHETMVGTVYLYILMEMKLQRAVMHDHKKWKL